MTVLKVSIFPLFMYKSGYRRGSYKGEIIHTEKYYGVQQIDALMRKYIDVYRKTHYVTVEMGGAG